ncbi:MAG: MBL fold metallo-hydrolase [Nitrospirae bacterium]|nr:MAG: MBL fold metallo-hydrolase [Nitrospirota bacterium]
MSVWTHIDSAHYVSLHPWVWLQLESAEPPGPFPFLGGVDPAVVQSLTDVHSTLLSAVETAISDVFARRAALDDPLVRQRLEDAYAEVVRSRPRLQAHIRCGRQADGTFYWEFPRDWGKSATITYAGVRIFNVVTRQAIPYEFDRPLAPIIGTFLGTLNGTRTLADIRSLALSAGRELERHLSNILDLLYTHKCLAISPRSSISSYWLAHTRDRDVIHLGHAALMYRQQKQFFWFDPWLMPWFAESPAPSLWVSLLPQPSAVFLTHDHDDHVDPRTLFHLPKDIPIIIPSRTNGHTWYYDYLSLLRELGFTQVIELAHGEAWRFDGGMVVAVPFYGEDPCDLALPRNCYLIVDRGYTVLIHADSGPTNDGRSALKDGVIANLVDRYGPLITVFASQQQLKELRTYAAHAPLSPPGQWLEVGENGFLTNDYLAELTAQAQAKLFYSYATGGAEWYPDHLSFMFSQRNPARTALLTAHWDPPASLAGLLASHACHYHYGQALDIVRVEKVGDELCPTVVRNEGELSPVTLYQCDHQLPRFLGGSS